MINFKNHRAPNGKLYVTLLPIHGVHSPADIRAHKARLKSERKETIFISTEWQKNPAKQHGNKGNSNACKETHRDVKKLVSFTVDEAQALEKQATAAGLDVSKYIRTLIANDHRPPA